MDNVANIDVAGISPDESVLVAMSGGVDSSVAAIALQEAGLVLHGCTMLLLEGDQDVCDQAAGIARALGFDHRVVDFRGQFSEFVIEPFCTGYLRGLTPNPCIMCNRSLKFGALHDLRESLDFDYLATGHYAQRSQDPESGLFELKRATDRAKDQSYFLSRISQEALAKTLFPMGGVTKQQARVIAAHHGLGNADSPESQDICFIKDGDYASFVELFSGRPSDPGPIELADGTVIGEHPGILRYTVGQRKGIGIAAAEPLYVIGIDAARNAVIVGPKPELMTSTVHGRDLSLISGDDPMEIAGPIEVEAQTHYRHKPVKGVASFGPEGNVEVVLEQPIVRAAPGQTLALYSGDIVLGGAIIAD